MLSQVASVVCLVTGIIYIVFSSKMEEKERNEQPAPGYPQQQNVQPQKPGPYQPPAEHV